MNIRNFGQKSVDEVKDKLVELGLSLKDSVPGFDVRTSTAATRTTRASKARVRIKEERPCPSPRRVPRLGGGPAHERLLLANLAAALFTHKSIQTTETKAKRLRPLAERLITFAKRGDLHARRRVMAIITDKGVVHELFTEIAPLVAERPGGYHPASSRPDIARATTRRWP